MKLTLTALLITLTLTGCSANSSVSSTNKGSQLALSGNYTEAIKLLKQSALKGDPVAQNNLGFMYYKGQGVRTDYKRAMYWYKKSAEQGYGKAMNNIGVLYGRGLGVQKNSSIEESWYEKALKNGYKKAEKNLTDLKREDNSKPSTVVKVNKAPLLGYTYTDRTNEYVLDKRKMDKFATEIGNRFTGTGKYITNNTQSVLFSASEHWAYRLKDWKNVNAFSTISKREAKNRQPNMNYCSSLIDVLDNNKSLQPKFSKSHASEVENYLRVARKYPALGLTKYNVTNQQVRLVEEYEYVWNRPAVCSCVINSEITQFCKKYGYQPLPITN